MVVTRGSSPARWPPPAFAFASQKSSMRRRMMPERNARSRAHLVPDGEPAGSEAIVVDGLLGTGSTGAPRGAVADAIRRIGEMRALGACVVALDIPSGLDASTGEAETAVVADLTITFGTAKRGALVRRDLCGDIVVVDIGLGVHAQQADGRRLPSSVRGWTHASRSLRHAHTRARAVASRSSAAPRAWLAQ